LNGLRDKPQRGNHHTLTKEQKQTIKEILTTKTPAEAGLSGRFWNKEQLQKLVEKEFGVRYQSPTAYYHLFTFCGFSYHKPDKVNKRQQITNKKQFEEKLKKDWRDIAETMGWSW